MERGEGVHRSIRLVFSVAPEIRKTRDRLADAVKLSVRRHGYRGSPRRERTKDKEQERRGKSEETIRGTIQTQIEIAGQKAETASLQSTRLRLL